MAVHIKNNWMMLPKKPESMGLDLGSGDKSVVTSATPKANIEVNVNDLNLATHKIKALTEMLKKQNLKTSPVSMLSMFDKVLVEGFTKAANGAADSMKEFGGSLSKVSLTQEKVGFGKVAPFPGMEFILDDLLKFLILSHGGKIHIYKEKLYHIQKHYSYNHPMDQVREALLEGVFDHLMHAIEGRHNPFYLTLAPIVVESLFSEGAYKFTLDTSELEPKYIEMTTMYEKTTIVKSAPTYVD